MAISTETMQMIISGEEYLKDPWAQRLFEGFLAYSRELLSREGSHTDLVN